MSVLSGVSASLLDRLATGATGLGTSAVRPLRPSLRDDRALGEEVNTRLVDWTEQVGIYPGELDRLHKASIGRLMMLAHSASGRHLGLVRR